MKSGEMKQKVVIFFFFYISPPISHPLPAAALTNPGPRLYNKLQASLG
jgi:hypothetical protein